MSPLTRYGKIRLAALRYGASSVQLVDGVDGARANADSFAKALLVPAADVEPDTITLSLVLFFSLIVGAAAMRKILRLNCSLDQ